MAISSVTAAQGFKLAAFNAMQTLTAADPNVLVTFGTPGQEALTVEDWVSFEDVEVEQSPATMGTNRSREENLTLTVVIETYRAGEDAQIASSDAAYALLGLLERHVRQTDTTLGGAVRQCFLARHRSQGFTAPIDMQAGRSTVIEATFTAAVRIT